MRWKLPFILSLSLLQGAADFQAGCGQDHVAGHAPVTAPSPDPGRGGQASGVMYGQTTQRAPSTGPLGGCGTPSSGSSLTGSLQNERADIVHGLPLPDILRSPFEPKINQ